MLNSLELIIALTVITLMFIIILMLFYSLHSLKKDIRLIKTNLSSNELLVNQLQGLFIKLDKSIKEHSFKTEEENIELHQVSKQLEHRIKNIQEDIQKLHQTQSQQPEDKLYSRAFKMVELGADAEELVRECDIPRAEADMLIAIHKKQNHL